MQRTLATTIHFDGVGLHSGAPVVMTIRPAARNTGIRFIRTDQTALDPVIPAQWDLVMPSQLCTSLANDDGVEISTVEHVMAALAGCGVHNAEVEVDGPEAPILDGSSAPYVAAILRAGLVDQQAPAQIIEVRSAVTVMSGQARARLEPADGVYMDYEIEFDDAVIGHQVKRLDLSNGTFARELCDSRTFCRAADVEAMHAQGLALGGTYDNAVVVEGDRVLSPGGFRHSDEAVRHKMLDAVGDLALAGAPILGRYTAHRGGHALTNQLLRTLFATPGAAVLRAATPEEAKRLPGVGLRQADFAAVA